jgi:hypothetical protein
VRRRGGGSAAKPTGAINAASKAGWIIATGNAAIGSVRHTPA